MTNRNEKGIDMDKEKEVNENYDVDILDLIYCENKDGCRNNHPCSVCRATYKRFSEALKAERTKWEEAEKKVAELTENLDKTICVWCGHVGKKNALELLNHVKECSKHPMNKSLVLIDALQSQLATANAKIVELEDKHEQEMIEVIKERDHREEQIDAIYEALGGTQQWSNLCDRGDDALELVASLESQLSEAKEKLNEAEFDLAQANEVLGERINNLIESRKADDARIVDLESQLSALNKRAEALESDKHALMLKNCAYLEQIDNLNKKAEGLVEAAENMAKLKHYGHGVGDKCKLVCKWADDAEHALKAFREGAE